MIQRDVIQTIRGLDEVLNVFRMNEGRLSARQIRARTMLSIARSEIAQDLSDACHDLKEGTELFVEHPADDSLEKQALPKESA